MVFKNLFQSNALKETKKFEVSFHSLQGNNVKGGLKKETIKFAWQGYNPLMLEL